MLKKNTLFFDEDNKKMFSTKVLVGKKIKVVQYRNFFKNKNLIKILEDKPLNDAVEVFMSSGLNISEASVKSFVHRNTLIYRIEKIYKTIGLNLKKFEDCIIYTNMKEIYNMVVKNYDV